MTFRAWPLALFLSCKVRASPQVYAAPAPVDEIKPAVDPAILEGQTVCRAD